MIYSCFTFFFTFFMFFLRFFTFVLRFFYVFFTTSSRLPSPYPSSIPLPATPHPTVRKEKPVGDFDFVLHFHLRGKFYVPLNWEKIAPPKGNRFSNVPREGPKRFPPPANPPPFPATKVEFWGGGGVKRGRRVWRRRRYTPPVVLLDPSLLPPLPLPQFSVKFFTIFRKILYNFQESFVLLSIKLCTIFSKTLRNF